MGLNELIARSGGEQFETMRKGWLPTQEETNARRLSDLNVQKAEQQVQDMPVQRQRREKRFDAEMVRNEQVTKMFEKKMKGFDTKEKADKEKSNLDTTERFIFGASDIIEQTGNPQDGIDIIRQNMDTLIEVGDDNADAMVRKIVDPKTDPKEAAGIIAKVKSLMPEAQRVLNQQRINLAKKSGGTAVERFIDAMPEGPEKDAATKAAREKKTGQQSNFKIIQTDKGMRIQDQTNNTWQQPDGSFKKENNIKVSAEQSRFDEKLSSTERKNRRIGTDKLRNEYSQKYKPFIQTSNTISQIKNIINSNVDNSVTDSQLTKLLMNLNSGGVRAKAMYDISNVETGNLLESLYEKATRAITGTRSKDEKQEILETVLAFEKNNNELIRQGKEEYRGLARNAKYNIAAVVPYKSFEELAKDDSLDEDEKLTILKNNPHLIPK